MYHALVQAIADGDAQNAEDLNAALDLRDRPVQAQSLRELLNPSNT